MDDVSIQTEDFDVAAECDRLTKGRGDIGALATFTGLVRGDAGLTAMTLEHYPAMTKAEIEAHVAEAKTRWPLLALRVVHRVGRLTPGARIVFVGIAAAHRGDAFAAAEFLMDYLKTRAPFWKLEERGGTTTWVAAKAEDDKAAERWTRYVTPSR